MQSSFIGEKKQSSIVLIGSFNPAMFHPSWFEQHNIISREETELVLSKTKEEQLIVTPQISSFKLDEVLFRVETNKMQFIAVNNVITPLLSLSTNVLNVLGATRILAYGFNFSAHYKIESVSDFQMIGDKLSPKEYWKTFLGSDIEGDERNGGLLSVRMKKTREKDEPTGYMIFEVAPSAMVKTGVFLTCNDHYAIDGDGTDAEIVSQTIHSSFEERVNFLEAQQRALLEALVHE